MMSARDRIKINRKDGRPRDRAGRFVKLVGMTRITVSGGWLFVPDEPEELTPPAVDRGRWGGFA